MAANRPHRNPSYRLHKPSNQGIVVLSGKTFYLGRFGSIESHSEYNRIIAEWLAAGCAERPAAGRGSQSRPQRDISVAALVEVYWRHAENYYVKNGEPTSEVGLIKLAMRPLNQIYGLTAANDFGPLGLKAVRQEFVNAGLCRNEVNRRTRLIVRMFRWAVENEMVPPSVHHGLKAVSGLRKGRTDVRESRPVRPVADHVIDAIRPHVSRQVWAMVELQRLSGMRPGEVVIMRTIDIDVSGREWKYTPESHKTEHHGRDRTVYLGPKAQEILRPWLRTELTAYLFDPRESVAERLATLRANRKTRVQPSQRDRRQKRPQHLPGERYTVLSYALAIDRGCDRAFAHPTLAKIKVKDLSHDQRVELKAWRVAHRWTPNQLRHTCATKLRREFGLEIAKAVLGHSSVVPTQIYAEKDQAAAAEAMLRFG